MKLILAFYALMIPPFGAMLNNTRTILQLKRRDTIRASFILIGVASFNDASIMIFDEGISTGCAFSFLIDASSFLLQALMSSTEVVLINTASAYFIVISNL